MKHNLKKILLSVVFLTGAAVLVVEVAATRILAPYFGNTIYTYSSVIGVVLAALSVGYYLGGKYSDYKPTTKIFFGIILLSGLSILFLELISIFFLPIFGYKLPITIGPLIASLVLFFVPSMLLGTLSPYTITLLKKNLPKEGVGAISGLVYFWSTIGSIFGSFFTGFYLIPHFGISEIIFATGIFLLIMGFTGLFFSKTERAGLRKIAIFSFFFSLSIFLLVLSLTNANAVYEKDGVYEKISIFDREYEGKNIRFFNQDKSASGAMYLDSDDLVYDYTKYWTLYKLFDVELKRSLLIGGGAYSIPKAIYKESPETIIEVVEIEPSLYDLAKKYFRLPDDPRIQNHVADGRRYLFDSNYEYDLIFSDVYYSIYSIPSHFTTKEFFELANNRLSDDGVFIANLIGSLSRQQPSLLFSEMRTFQSVFPNSYFIAVNDPQSTEMQNIIFVGLKNDSKLNVDDLSISNLNDQLFSNLNKKYIDVERFELSSYPIIEDNYAPVDFLTADMVKKQQTLKPMTFEGKEAYALVEQQLRYGPRFLSSTGHERVINFIEAEMKNLADKTYLQTWTHNFENQDYKLTNVVVRFRPELKSRVIIGTHFDSKRFADKDKAYPESPVPGANDSASGTALLIELARYLAYKKEELKIGVDLVFFDGEEGEENLSNTNWIPLGSSYFAENLADFYPENEKQTVQAIIIDLVCDSDLSIYRESFSNENNPEGVEYFWSLATKKWPDNFFNEVKYKIFDDHVPLQRAGIPSLLLIDYDYPSFHTTEDTVDKCSSKSLEIVGTSLVDYLNKVSINQL